MVNLFLSLRVTSGLDDCLVTIVYLFLSVLFLMLLALSGNVYLVGNGRVPYGYPKEVRPNLVEVFWFPLSAWCRMNLVNRCQFFILEGVLSGALQVLPGTQVQVFAPRLIEFQGSIYCHT